MPVIAATTSAPPTAVAIHRLRTRCDGRGALGGGGGGGGGAAGGDGRGKADGRRERAEITVPTVGPHPRADRHTVGVSEPRSGRIRPSASLRASSW